MKKVFFMAPGILEIPNIRGGGIEHNIMQLTERSQLSSFIFSPRPIGPHKKVQNPKIAVKYSVVPAIKKYPLPPHIGLSSLGALFTSLIFSLEASIQILQRLRMIHTVIVFDKFWGLLPSLIARAARKKSVYMEYNIWPWTYQETQRSVIYSIQLAFGRLICRINTILTTNSPSIKNGMIAAGVKSSRISILPTGIDSLKLTQQPITRPDKKFLRVLYVGRLVEERGADLLQDVIYYSTRINHNLHFRIAGGGPLFNTLRDFVEQNNLSSNVTLLNQISRPEVLDELHDTDIVLFISKNENFGSLALLESMALGCPIIATNVGSTSIIVKDHKNGRLVKPEAKSIADAILDLEKDRTELIRMGEESRRFALDYDWGIVANEFAKIIG